MSYVSRTFLCCLSLALALVFARGAHAQSADDKARATQLLKEGVALLDRQDHAAALVKFEQAYALVPSAKIQFNLGLAYEGLGRAALAWRAYRAYLEGAKTDAAVRRKEAEKSLEILRGRVGFLKVTSDLPGAKVTVDGVAQGETPLPEPVAVEPGAHHVLVEAPGHDGWTRVVAVAPGGVLDVKAEVRKTPEPSPEPVREQPLVLTPPAPAQSPSAVAQLEHRQDDTPAPVARPFYKRAWFWGVVGAVALSAAATGIALSTGGEVRRTCAAGIDTCVGGQ